MHIPSDYPPPPVSYLISHPRAAALATALISIWPTLCRVSPRQSQFSSLIALPHPFFIPGGRFRECYYWDTLWTVKGLIASNMLQSAKNAVRNLFYLVHNIGFIPNGNRVYYLNRTQPPILTEASLIIYNALPSSDALAWLREAMPALEKEHKWLQENRNVGAIHLNSPPDLHPLSVYYASTKHPRPESHCEDMKTGGNNNARLFSHIASAAESGWDFSSRWFPQDGKKLHDIETSNILPCCLNGLLLKAERDMSHLHAILARDTNEDEMEHTRRSEDYSARASARATSMMQTLWDAKRGMFFDYAISRKERTKVVSGAGLIAVWGGAWQGVWTMADAVQFVQAVNGELMVEGGLPVSNVFSGEQWDFPNCWAPVVDFAVGGLLKVEDVYEGCGAGELAQEIAKRFLRAVWQEWARGHVVHEKYDARHVEGMRGVGGEYLPQTGFAWTNGVALWLLRDFPHALA